MPRSILPMQLQIGDRFTDEEGEWEVTHRPSRGGSRAGSVREAVKSRPATKRPRGTTSSDPYLQGMPGPQHGCAEDRNRSHPGPHDRPPDLSGNRRKRGGGHWLQTDLAGQRLSRRFLASGA